MSGDFGAAVARIRSAMGADEWQLPEPPRSTGPSEELQERRRAGRAAYERSMVARGMSARTARVWASASYLFDGLDDLQASPAVSKVAPFMPGRGFRVRYWPFTPGIGPAWWPATTARARP